MRRLFAIWLGIIGVGVSGLVGAPDARIIPLSEIEEGMEGVWRTVVKGDEIQEFPLKVLGVAHHFIGPGKHIIFCEALDEANQLSGPVSGMSGSPVYINGRVAGAYAYGFSQAKDQAIIGVTPIEDMLGMWDERATPALLVEQETQRRESLPVGMQAAGVSMALGGVEGRWLELFPESYGFDQATAIPMARAMSGGESGATVGGEATLQPGAPMAAVLMDGDFNLAAVGTVTWREGEKLLGFGHPFFSFGHFEMPLAPAKVFTVVRSYGSSFKLSEVGEVVGKIDQDRLPGVSAKIGEFADMIDFEIVVEDLNGRQEEHQASFIRHPRLSPVLAAIGVGQVLSTTLATEAEMTSHVVSRITFANEEEPVVLYSTLAGNDLMAFLRFVLIQQWGLLFDNPLTSFPVESMRVEIKLQRGNQSAWLDEVGIETMKVEPGESVPVRIRLKPWQGEMETLHWQWNVPQDLKPGKYELFIGDALGADRRDQSLAGEPRSATELLARMRALRDPSGLYIQLYRATSGYRIEGEEYTDIPLSLAMLLDSPQNQIPLHRVVRKEVFEDQLQTGKALSGTHRFLIEVVERKELK